MSGVFLEAAPCDVAASLSTLMYESKARGLSSCEFRLNEMSPALQTILKEVACIVDRVIGH